MCIRDRAFWYLLKPVSEERLFSVLDQWLTSMQASLRHFAARTISGYQNIYLRDVEYLEAVSYTHLAVKSTWITGNAVGAVIYPVAVCLRR